jgi:hypothetical protein
LNARNFRKYLCKSGTQGTSAHFGLPGCAVTSDLSDLQLNKGTRHKAQGTRKERFFHNDRRIIPG